jgi:hypothetical protein
VAVVPLLALAVLALVVVVLLELLPHAAIARLAHTQSSRAKAPKTRLRRWDLLLLGIGLASE